MATQPITPSPAPTPLKDTAKNREMIVMLMDNWRNEVSAAGTYRVLAQLDPDPNRQRLLIKMAESEDKHAVLWQQRLADLGVTVSEKDAEREVAKQRRYARWFGTDAALRRIEKEERGHVVSYTAQTEKYGSAEDRAILAEIIDEEQAHADRLAMMAATGAKAHHAPKGRLDAMMATEKWHQAQTGGWLGDAIYGANDGLGAVFGTVSTVAGATGGSKAVLLAGIAVMLASALSMGAGAYLATKAESEVHDAELARERREIEMDPEHEREELELMYQLKGFSEDEAHLLAARLTQNPEQFLHTMAAEELGLSMQTPPNPFVSALSGTVSTAVGAFIPLIPFFFMTGMTAIIWAGIISLAAHFAIGAAKTLVTGRSWVASGTEMTVVGLLLAVVTYLIGLALGGVHLG